jgi:hypothetical protein
VVRDTARLQLYRWPDFLPGGDRVLVSTGTALEYQTGVVDLETGHLELIAGAKSHPRYVEPGWLLSVTADGTLIAMPFDARRGRATGSPVPVLEGIYQGLAGAAKLAVSRNGWATYVGAVHRNRRLAVVDRQGTATTLAVDAKPYIDPRFSPSGRDVVVTVLGPGGGLAGDLWVLNVDRGTGARLTFEGSDQFPDWSADGRRIVYTTLRGANGVYWKSAGGGAAELLFKPAEGVLFEAVLANDQNRVIYRLGGIPGDLYWARRDSSRAPRELVASRFDERAPALSPDGRWLAFVSDETGLDQVYVQPFPEGSGRWPISPAGGTEPRWRRDGSELFYRNADTLFAVSVQTRPDFSVADRVALFTGRYLFNDRHASYDVHPSGDRFIFVVGEAGESGELWLVQNVLAPATRSGAGATGR